MWHQRRARNGNLNDITLYEPSGKNETHKKRTAVHSRCRKRLTPCDDLTENVFLVEKNPLPAECVSSHEKLISAYSTEDVSAAYTVALSADQPVNTHRPNYTMTVEGPTILKEFLFFFLINIIIIIHNNNIKTSKTK